MHVNQPLCFEGTDTEDMDVSWNSGTPKSSILIGFSIINHAFWGTSIFGNTHVYYISKTAKWGTKKKSIPPVIQFLTFHKTRSRFQPLRTDHISTIPKRSPAELPERWILGCLGWSPSCFRGYPKSNFTR